MPIDYAIDEVFWVTKSLHGCILDFPKMVTHRDHLGAPMWMSSIVMPIAVGESHGNDIIKGGEA